MEERSLYKSRRVEAKESGDDLNMKLLTGTISQSNALIRQLLPMMMMIIIITITTITII